MFLSLEKRYRLKIKLEISINWIHNIGMKKVLVFLLVNILCHGVVLAREADITEHLVPPKDSFYDPTFDYSFFKGRVTDRDETTRIFKVESGTKNTRLFRIGDMVEFTINQTKVNKRCQGFVRSVEEKYFVIYVADIKSCLANNEYFRRGSVLRFKSEVLSERVRQASAHRKTLLERKSDLFNQLNNVNDFLWGFDQKSISVAAEYDKEILRIKRQKQEAIDNLQLKRQEQFNLQKELVFHLDQLEKDLDFYLVEKRDQTMDRWFSDLDMGLPVETRPQEYIPLTKESETESVRDYRNKLEESFQ